MKDGRFIIECETIQRLKNSNVVALSAADRQA